MIKKTLSAILLLITVNAKAQVGLAAGTGAFAIAFNKLADVVNGIIQQIQNTGVVLEVNAASQVSAVLNNAKLVYESELSNSAGTMSAQEQAVIASLTNYVTNLQKAIIDPTLAQTQQILNTVPFSNKFPQVTTLSGAILLPSVNVAGNAIHQVAETVNRLGAINNAFSAITLEMHLIGPIRDNIPDTDYIQQVAPAKAISTTMNNPVTVQNSPNSYFITIKGNFPDIGDHDFNAVLTVKGKDFQNTTKTTNTISFTISADVIGTASNKVFYIPFTVHIPYYKTTALVFKKKMIADFSFQFIKLPTNAGSIEIFTSQTVDATVSMYTYLNGLIWDSSQDDIDKINGVATTDGWTCDRNSVNCIFTRREGEQNKDWYDLGNASDATYIGWHFKTLHKGFGTSGKLTVNLHYREYKTIKVNRTATTGPIPIGWGESSVFTYDPQARFAIVYHQWDGKDFAFAADTKNNPFITFQSIGSSLQINTVPY